jgi:predicted transcriptional regulator
MRTLVDIPDDQVAQLNKLAAEERVSRAALLREAIADLLAKKHPPNDDAIAAAFGIRPDMEDGLTYQERLRSEW